MDRVRYRRNIIRPVKESIDSISYSHLFIIHDEQDRASGPKRGGEEGTEGQTGIVSRGREVIVWDI